MHTSRLLHTLRPHWARDEHPVFHLEARRRVHNRALMALRWGCLPGILAVTGLSILVMLAIGLSSGSLLDGDYGTQNVLGVTAFLLLIVQVAAGAMVNVLVIAQAAPAVSGEIELQSWRLLRATTLPVRDILLAKLAAVFEHLRLPFAGLVILRLVTVGTGLLFYGYTLYLDFFGTLNRRDWQEFLRRGEWIPILLVTLVFLIYFMLQPPIQLVLNGTLGMLASVLAPSRSRAMASALIGRLAGWVGSILLNLGAIYGLVFLVNNWTQPESAAWPIFRGQPPPGDDLVRWVTCLVASFYILIVLAGQIGFIRGALRFTERRARRLGA